MNRFTLTALSAALCLSMSSLAIGSVMSKTDYKSAQDGISAKYKSDMAACAALSGNAKDICTEEGKGAQMVAKAELEATNNPSSKHRYDVRLAKADAVYAVAMEKCDDLSGNPKDVCVKEAKAAHVTAKADAKLANRTSEANTTAREKTSDANTAAGAKTLDARKDAEADKRDAAYAVAKEKCDAFAGDVKATCIKDAKVRYGQS